MYNPNALVQTLETASMVEQNLLDSLRGPDAAHRITDEQIRAIITSPSFKPRYGRPYYYDVFYEGDMDTFLFFCPYDSQHNDLQSASLQGYSSAMRRVIGQKPPCAKHGFL